jgi:hypothetical protein
MIRILLFLLCLILPSTAHPFSTEDLFVKRHYTITVHIEEGGCGRYYVFLDGDKKFDKFDLAVFKRFSNGKSGLLVLDRKYCNVINKESFKRIYVSHHKPKKGKGKCRIRRNQSVNRIINPPWKS